MASRLPSIDRRRRQRRARGFTLAESLIAATVLAGAVAGLFAPLSASHRQNAVLQQNNAAISLAEQLLDEISAKPFADPTDGSMKLGPESGEYWRPLFDNIDDYHGYRDTTDELRDASGNAIAWSSGERYTRSVTAEYRTSPSGTATTTGDYILVTVTVESGSGQVRLSRMFTRYTPK